MKKLTLITLALGAMVAISIPGFAQKAAAAPTKGHLKHAVKRGMHGLNLTKEQQAQIKPIMQAQKERLLKLRQDTTLTKEQKRAQFRAIREATMNQISPILTPEQRTKLQTMRSKWENHQKAHQGAKGARKAGKLNKVSKAK